MDQIAGGAQVVVRDEEWIVRSVQQTPSDGLMVRCIGTSTLVRDTEATFFNPHNGDPESFAELIRLLDPTAIADPKAVTRQNIEHLYVRRHKGNAEVTAEAGSHWADRLPPTPIPVDPTPAEQAVFTELAEVWTHPPAGTKAPASGTGATLFPWTLFKAALSSHRALAATVRNRRKSLRDAGGELAEDAALARLGELADAFEEFCSVRQAAMITEIRRRCGIDQPAQTAIVSG